jgi:hypothetical protein
MGEIGMIFPDLKKNFLPIKRLQIFKVNLTAYPQKATVSVLIFNFSIWIEELPLQGLLGIPAQTRQ